MSRTIVISVAQPLFLLPEYPCEVTSVKHGFRKTGNGMIYQKDWPFTRLFNSEILQLSERGLVDQIIRKWTFATPLSACESAGPRYTNLEDVASAILLWGFGILFGIVICLFC